MANAGRILGGRNAQPRLLGCTTVQTTMVGRLPHPKALDIVRSEQSAAPLRAMRPDGPAVHVSNWPCIVDELVSPSCQVQCSTTQPASGGLVRATEGLADADCVYRFGSCPAHAWCTNVHHFNGGPEIEPLLTTKYLPNLGIPNGSDPIAISKPLDVWTSADIPSHREIWALRQSKDNTRRTKIKMGTTAMTKSPTLRNMAVFPRHSFHHASSLILVNCLLHYAEKQTNGSTLSTKKA